MDLTKMEFGDKDWSRTEIKEIVTVVPDGDQWIWSGDVSDLMNYVFSASWAEHMYDENPSYFWADIHKDLESREGAAEIEIDMVYDFGGSTEERVRAYMKEHMNEGPRFLIMPRTETVTMACGWLRSYVIRDVESI